MKSYLKTDTLCGYINREANGSLYVKISDFKKETYNAQRSVIASKLLSNDEYGISACQDELGYIKIVMGTDIIVRFEGEIEEPFLELPPHVAYTC